MLKQRTTADAPSPASVDVGVPSRLTAVGRRKSAIARVRLSQNGSGTFIVNGRAFDQYFPTLAARVVGRSALDVVGQLEQVNIEAKIVGGGLRAQADALRLGIARALCILNPTFRHTLKEVGYLTRDARVRERKKPGLKRARKAPQWAKR